MLSALAFLLPRAILPGSLAPAGLAFLLALAATGVEHAWWYTMVALAGLLSLADPVRFLGSAPAFLLPAFIGHHWVSLSKPSRFIAPTAAVFVLGRTIASRFLEAGPFRPALPAEAALVILLAVLLTRAMPVLRHGPSACGGDEEPLYLALIPFTLTVAGLTGLTAAGVHFSVVAGAFFVALLAYLGGPGLGSGLGVLLAAIPVGSGAWPPAGSLALGGLLGGLLRRRGRLLSFLGLAVGFGLPLLWPAMRRAAPWPGMAQAALGAGLFLLLPDKPLRRLGPTPPSARAVKHLEQARLREILSDRVQQMAQVFTQMSKAFQACGAEPGERPDLYAFLEQVVRGTCQQCVGYDACWRQNFYASYRELFDLIALAEMNGAARRDHLRGRLATACLQERKLLEAVDRLLATVQADSRRQRKQAENREFVAEQLEGVAGIIADLAKEMRLDVEFRVEVEEKLKTSLNRLGLSVDYLSALEYGQNMLEIRIRKRECLNHFECQYLVAPMVGRILGHPFDVWDRQCPAGGRCGCSFALIPSGRFQVRHAAGQIAKEEGHCGDNLAVVRTKDGRCALILSDGMGTGKKAAMESKATVDLLAQLLGSGLREDFALNLVNSVIMLRTPEERFATVDVALIDLFRGQAELIKVGAAPSYIKRGRTVIPIRSTTPPAGILDRIEVDRQRYPLYPGDYLVLVSDGVFAGALGPEESEDWVERALSRVEVAGPEPLVDFVLKLAQTNMGNEPCDDVTVVAAQLLPAGP